MLSWYEYEFIVGGMNFPFPEEVYLNAAHKLSVEWSIKGLIILNTIPGGVIRYKDGSTVFLNESGLLLPWTVLEKGEAEVLVDDKLMAKCVARKETSIEKWEQCRGSIKSSYTTEFDLAIKILKYLRGKSISDLNSDIQWFQELIDKDKSLAEIVKTYMTVWETRRIEHYYEVLFCDTVYNMMSKDKRRLSKTALRAVYDDIVR